MSEKSYNLNHLVSEYAETASSVLIIEKHLGTLDDDLDSFPFDHGA